MKLWYQRLSASESHGVRANECPGDGWYEIERFPEPGETVTIVDGKAQIRAPEVDAEAEARAAKRAAIQAALPDILLAAAEGKDVGEEVRKVLNAAAEVAKAKEGTCSKTS
jgi:hypothetical protein